MPGNNEGEKKRGMYVGWGAGRQGGRAHSIFLAPAPCGSRKAPPPGERTLDSPVSTDQRSTGVPHTRSKTDQQNTNLEVVGKDAASQSGLLQADLHSAEPGRHQLSKSHVFGTSVLGVRCSACDGGPMLPHVIMKPSRLPFLYSGPLP